MSSVIRFLKGRGDLTWRKIIRVAIFTLVILAILLLDIYYYYPAALPPAVSGHSLKVEESFSQTFTEPNNVTFVSFGVTVLNGIAPYEFKAVWSDNFTQENNLGTFSRTFQEGQSIPSGATVIISDAENQVAEVNISVSSTTSSTTTSLLSTTATFVAPPTGTVVAPTTTFHATGGVIEFFESGLKSGDLWNISIDGMIMTSMGNESVFIGPFGSYNYSVSYSYTNVNMVYNVSPSMGTVRFDKPITVVNITFSQIPVDQLFSILGKPTIALINGTLSVNSTFKSVLPFTEKVSICRNFIRFLRKDCCANIFLRRCEARRACRGYTFFCRC